MKYHLYQACLRKKTPKNYVEFVIKSSILHLFLLSVSNDQTSTPSIPKCLTHFYALLDFVEVEAYESSLMPLICTENF